MFLSIQAAGRKLKRSLSQRGIVATTNRFITKPLEFARSWLWEFSAVYRQCRQEELDFDRRLNIETAVDADPAWIAKIKSANWIHGIGYAPVPIRIAHSLLAGLDLEYERYVFIDFGAGKGRMLFLASEFPFRRIIGVEYAPDLYEKLQINLRSYRNPAQKCQAIEALLQDAAQFALPLEPLVLFFHHPFEAPIFRQIIDQIKRSGEKWPRDIRAIYYDPICGDLFDGSGYFQRVQHGQRDARVRYSSDWAIFRSRTAETVVRVAGGEA